MALLVDAADSEHALVSRIVSYKNLGDGDKQIEDDDDETVIDLRCGKDFAPTGRQRRFSNVGAQAGGNINCELVSLYQPSLLLQVFDTC